MCTIDVDHYLEHNKNWVKNTLLSKPDYFKTLYQGQSPKALLLGCSDSRVSPSMVLGSDLGDLFIHRNIANIVSHADLSLKESHEKGSQVVSSWLGFRYPNRFGQGSKRLQS